MEGLTDRWVRDKIKGLPAEVTDTVLASISAETRVRRGKDVNKFLGWLREKELKVFNASHVLTFLDKSPSAATYYNMRTAIATTIRLSAQFDITELSLVQRHAKGWAAKHPNEPRYETMFDLMVLYEFLGKFNPDKSRILDVRTKAFILLRLSVAARSADMFHVDFDSIQFFEDHLKFRYFRWKTQRSSGRRFSNFFIVRRIQTASICAFTWFKFYFLLCKKQHQMHEDDPQPRTPWFKMTGGRLVSHKTFLARTSQLMAAAGIDMSMYGAGSLRHAAISLWRKNGCTIDEVRRRTGHRSLGIITKYYDRAESSVDLTAKILQDDHADESDNEDEWLQES